MKKKFLFIIGFVLSTLSVQATDIGVLADLSGVVSKEGKGIASSIVYTGSPGTDIFRSGIIIFELPVLPEQERLESAGIFVNLERVNNNKTPVVGLYALRISDQSKILGSDYYTGPFSDGDHGTAIMEKFIEPGAYESKHDIDDELRTDEAAGKKLTSWLRAQYDGCQPKKSHAVFRLSTAAEPEKPWSFVVIDGAGRASSPVLTLSTKPSLLARVKNVLLPDFIFGEDED